jgi:nicotinamidase-related amidase
MKPSKINKGESILVLIDYQERLMPAMKDCDKIQKAAEKLIKGCKALEVPILVTQQYTKGLGPTISPLNEALGDYKPIEKISFSAMGEHTFCEKLKKSGKKTVILAGIEAHVCVMQTAIDLVEAGYSVFIVSDCISSRSEEDKIYAEKRMASAGVIYSTCESVLFELLKSAKHKNFKEISSLVK